MTNQYIINDIELMRVSDTLRERGALATADLFENNARSHPYQSERDKVLDELYNWCKEKDKIILSDHRIPLWELEHKIAELRQAGEL